MAAKKRKKKTATRKKKGGGNPFRYLFVLLLAACGMGIFWYYKEKKIPLPPHEFKASLPEGFQSIGIDVSHHQGHIDWKKIFEQSAYDTLISFVYCKATEGLDHVDTKWEHNRKSLNELGVINGAYHFFRPKTPALEQAVHFLKHWKPRDVDLPPALDVEVEGIDDEDLIANMKIWLEYVEKETGRRPIIYTSLNFYETKFAEEFTDYRFWIAAYSRRPANIADKRIIHWQYSEVGRIPTIKWNVDLNASKLTF